MGYKLKAAGIAILVAVVMGIIGALVGILSGFSAELAALIGSVMCCIGPLIVIAGGYLSYRLARKEIKEWVDIAISAAIYSIVLSVAGYVISIVNSAIVGFAGGYGLSEGLINVSATAIVGLFGLVLSLVWNFVLGLIGEAIGKYTT